jgi:peptide/nickel transport system substrate-binding protein
MSFTWAVQPRATLASLAMIALSTSAMAYSEAPSLAAKVTAGGLPPVEQRLPDNPLELKPLESVGKYGGTWRMALIGGTDSLIERTLGYTRLVRWNPEWTDTVPDVAEKVDAKADGTEYVFTLRKGMKWSDGAPFTVDDIMFWYTDVLMNSELTPAVPSWLRSGGKPVIVEKLDDTRVRFSFAAPHGTFLQKMATLVGADVLAGSPAHWLKQFHKKYNPDGVDALVKAAGSPSWTALFLSRVSWPDKWRDPARPVLDPWMLTVAYDGTSQVEAVRNPYFYAVDPAGNQLPYVDKLTFTMFGDQQSLILKASNGELDMQSARLGSIEAQKVIAQNRERGGYRLFKARPAWSNAMQIMLNQTSKNPALREVFAKKDFRIGLSHAINRDELNQIIFSGLARPYQAAPRPDTALYNEKMATQYLKYDPQMASELLDKAGFAQKDAGGFRLGPDGQRISFAIEVTVERNEQIDALELVKKYWAAVGIEMQVKPVQQPLAFARMKANDHDAIVWVGGGGYDLLGLLDPKWYLPYEDQSSYASAWGIYNQNSKDPNAQQPPDYAVNQQKLYAKLQATPGLDGQLAIMREILETTQSQFYVIGTNMAPDNYGVVKNNMRNVPELMPDTLFAMTPGLTNPAQYYFE